MTITKQQSEMHDMSCLLLPLFFACVCTCLSEEAGILQLGLAFLLLQLLVGTLGQRPADQRFELTDGELHTCWVGYRDDRQSKQADLLNSAFGRQILASPLQRTMAAYL